MGKPYIVIGDKTSHGGVVVEGAATATINGKPIALVGSKVTCPEKGHGGTTVIVAGDPDFTIDGKPAARHGDKTACGATLIASQSLSFDDEGGGDVDSAASSAATETALAAADQALAQFDEQLCFVNAKGRPLSGVAYALKLDDGSLVSGTTDDKGLTSRVRTRAAARITEASLTPKPFPTCCSFAAQQAPTSVTPLVFSLTGVSTHAANIGTSVRQIQTPAGQSRGMTSGEIAMARSLFGTSVDYTKVKVHNGEYLWFGLQPDDVAMTPNGEMYFNPSYFQEDFSNSGSFGNALWFMHEMVHVWQYQLGYPVARRGAIRIGLSYEYRLSATTRLSDYNMEAQGNLLADYWAIKTYRDPPLLNQWTHANDLALYRSVLKDFIANPSDVTNLPS